MASISPTRPSRRAATRRKAVIESSEDEDTPPTTQPTNTNASDEEDFTPAPQRSPRRQSRRKTSSSTVAGTPKPTRSRKPRPTDGIEPSELFDPEESTAAPASPSKKPSPRKRQSVSSQTPGPPRPLALRPPLPTPQPSASPEPPGTPLGDITSTTLNHGLPSPGSEPFVERIKVLDTILEKPMDIVTKARALGVVPVDSGPAEAKPRTVITHLVLVNFKSYAGRQDVGPFHASFSSVVGPNGSGKSNVIDSLLFVFGFRASKMRQGKISALIHNSAAFPDLPYCEVEVHFQEVMDLPDGKHEVMPNSTLIVSRKAFRNNSSKYYINSHESNFTNVTTLLRDRGVDLDHKRFLILQGEVESIAQMKPKAANEHDDGLLEYLEDIIGTSRYKKPIEESAAEVETLNETCAEKNTRVQHVEKEKNNLEDKKNKALAFIRDANDLAMKQSALYQIFIDECNDNTNVMGETVGRLQQQLDAELAKHKGNQDGIEELSKNYKRGGKELESLAKETQLVLKETAKFEKESVKYEEKKKFLLGKQSKLEKFLGSSNHEIHMSSTKVRGYDDDMRRNTTDIAALEERMKEEEILLLEIRDSLKGKTQEFSDKITIKQKALEPWNEKVNEKQSAIAVAQSELDILHEKNNAGNVALEEIQTKVTGFEEARAAKLAELDELKVQKSNCEKEVKEKRLEVEKLASKEPELRSRLSGARQKADEARASLSKSQTQGNVLTGLMRLKESGRIEGFHGRLGNLGSIDQKYDVAISTACPSLDNIVVDTVEVGQQCIDYLRKNSLGRAMFILLDRLPQRDLSPIDTPEGVPRLFDLVKSKHEKFRPAFFSVLQNTLVANDLAQANRIAYGAQRWRVVTLDGQLIDKSGTMTGGGTRVSKGAMSSKIIAETSKEQVSKFELDRDALEQEFLAFQEQQREADQSIKDLLARLPKIEVSMQKIQLEIESSERNLADAQRRVKELSSQNQTSKSNDSRASALEKKIAAWGKEIAKLRSEMAGAEEEIRVLQEKMMEAGGVRMRAQKAKADGLKEQIDTIAGEISAAEVAKAKAEAQRVKHEKASEEAKGEIQVIVDDLEKLEEEISSFAETAKANRIKAEKAQEALDEKKYELDQLKSELDEKTAIVNETRGVEIDMRNKLEENQKILTENQKRSRYWQDKLSILSFQNISDLGEPDELTHASLPTYTKDELLDMSKDTLKAEIAHMEEKTHHGMDLSVLAEYRRRVDEHAARSADLSTAVSARDAAKQRCDLMRRQRLEGFMTGFSAISLRLKEMYQMITMGGNAELELVDSLDPFSEGILFSVMPPKKSWKNISNLSGGEKTLSSLALVFALHHYKPTPLYVMDEIDAALDFRNVSIVASYIKERTKNAQFIVISLRNNMFELASRLVGVYKVNHMVSFSSLSQFWRRSLCSHVNLGGADKERDD
ncbi:MAG: hypothetical protein M1829_005168 [Trizodia sp. TS-e1964]|nr:MAG: hypothetical protein M1829_005168 [Trizodia sp. TS-e1964]